MVSIDATDNGSATPTPNEHKTAQPLASPSGPPDRELRARVDEIVFRCFSQGQYWGSADITMDGQLNPNLLPEDPIDRTEAVVSLLAILKDDRTALLQRVRNALPKEISSQETEDRQLGGWNYVLTQVNQVLDNIMEDKK